MLFYRVLELAIGHTPVRYHELVANPKAKPVPPRPPGGGGHPPTDHGATLPPAQVRSAEEPNDI